MGRIDERFWQLNQDHPEKTILALAIKGGGQCQWEVDRLSDGSSLKEILPPYQLKVFENKDELAEFLGLPNQLNYGLPIACWWSLPFIHTSQVPRLLEVSKSDRAAAGAGRFLVEHHVLSALPSSHKLTPTAKTTRNQECQDHIPTKYRQGLQDHRQDCQEHA